MNKRKLYYYTVVVKKYEKFTRSLQENNDKYADVITKLDHYFKPRKNISYERYLFKQEKQLIDESSNVYVTRVKRLGGTCEFPDLSTEIKDHFIVTCRSNSLRKKLLREENLDLERLLKIARKPGDS